MPSEQELASLYDEHYYDHWGVAVDEDEVFALKRRSARRYLHRLLELDGTLKGGRLLDIGCAHGFLLAEARALGFEPVGLEVSPAREIARARVGCEVYGSFEEMRDLAPHSLRAVTMIDVVEHLPDPVRALADVSGRLLQGGGWLLVVTPDVNSLTARVRPSSWPHFKREHVCYYGRGSLARLFDRLGFDVVTAGRSSRYVTLRYVAQHYARYQPRSAVGYVLRALCGIAPRRLCDHALLLPSELIMIGIKRL